MARIPTILSEPIRGVLPNSGNPAMGTPDAFGASIGEAVARGGREEAAGGLALGQSLVGAGVAAGNLTLDIEKRMNDSATASGVANFDFTKDYIDLQKTPPKDGATYQEAVANAYDTKVEKYLEGMPNDQVRNRVRDRLVTAKKSYVEAAAQYQDRVAVDVDKQSADAGLTTQLNGVFVDGSIDNYNDRLQKGLDVIDARPNLPPNVKEGMKKGYTEKLAQRRFEGLINASHNDPEALAGLEAELRMPNSPWLSRMSDESYQRTLDRIVTLKHAASSQESAAARSALQSVTQRNNDGVLIDPQELSAVQSTVMASKNPALLSQFAMINRAQDIYRTHRDLPLEEQRRKIEEMKNRKGVAGLPAPVQAGIAEGAALTGGQVSAEYLAGLVGFEYGGKLASGDYGQGTGHTINGKPSSDAAGVTQMTSPTWRSIVRTHAAALGVNPTASDAEIEALRTDKTEAGAIRQIKAAALHAADNKRILEGSLGRPVNDGDLYFAHFLGTGGAVRFLSAATQNPDAPATSSVAPEQVAANRPVFFDESGRPRSNAQVRAFVADATMNGMSRVDYAGLKAAMLIYNNTLKGLRDDPITFAGGTGRFGDVGNISTRDGMERRGVVVGQIAEFYKIPFADLKPFTKDEAETLAKTIRDGTADEAIKVLAQVQGLATPALIAAANKQIGEKDGIFGHAAGLAFNMPSQTNVATDIIRGEKRLKLDKDLQTTIGATETERIALFNSVVGKAVFGFDPSSASATQLRKAADALYVERFLGRGTAKVGSMVQSTSSDYATAIQLVLGGGMSREGKAIDTVNGKQMVLPQGLTAPEFVSALNRMGDNDYTANSKFGGPPRYADGTVAKARDIANEGVFVSLGGGEYVIRMSDGKELVSAVYKDGSSNRYVFRANPSILRDIASRTNARPPASATEAGTALP